MNFNALEKITVEENNANYVSIDGVLYNKEKTELVKYPHNKAGESIEIENTVTKIRNNAFWDCDKLTSIILPDSVLEIGSSAFDSCSGLLEVKLGKNTTKIGTYAFRNCDKLTSIVIPDSVLEMGSSAFYSCSGLL